VRISKYKTPFENGYKQNYTTELYKIVKVNQTKLITYELEDYNGDKNEGIFFDSELVIYNKQDQEYEIEKVIKTKTVNGKKKYFVKWKGYPESMNCWVDKIN
ncbi:uncharacterized protein B4U79_00742, partial [Dinothrombium tinctorium]